LPPCDTFGIIAELEFISNEWNLSLSKIHIILLKKGTLYISYITISLGMGFLIDGWILEKCGTA
jgi:hypothetical protein